MDSNRAKYSKPDIQSNNGMRKGRKGELDEVKAAAD